MTTRARLTGYVDRWAPAVLVIAALFVILFWLAALVAIYWGDEYGAPPWNERSFPAPIAY